MTKLRLATIRESRIPDSMMEVYASEAQVLRAELRRKERKIKQLTVELKAERANCAEYRQQYLKQFSKGEVCQ